MDESNGPAWLANARWYYSKIGDESSDPVTILTAAAGEEVNSDSPGTPCWYLEPHFRFVRVLDVARQSCSATSV